MPALDLNQSLVRAQADVSAGDWGSAAAGLSMDIQVGAALDRGIKLEIGASAMAELSASFRKFLAADAEVRATASARLKGQIQAPLDLFTEAGMALRLQAVAELSILGRLAIGLSIGDFLALANQDPRIQGIPFKLLTIFLEEVDVQAGVTFKAAFSAMAYANLVISGRLIEDKANNFPAGFTVAGEFGVGAKGGVGYQMFANMGFKDTGRAVRRTIDTLIDAAITEMQKHAPDATTRQMLFYFRTPAKMSLRAGFEVGLALAASAPTLADDGANLAARTVQILMEELQRFILEQLTMLGTLLFQRALAELGIEQSQWDATAAQREHFATLLRNPPPDPFDLTDSQNILYWKNLIAAGATIAVELGDNDLVEAKWVESLAILWSAVQLTFAVTQRVSNAEARVSFLGTFDIGANTEVPAFSGELAANGAPPPSMIWQHINTALHHGPNEPLTQDHLVEYLVSDVIIAKLIDEFPELRIILNIVIGPESDSFVSAAQTILRNAGSFIHHNGTPDPQRTLVILANGLQTYIQERVEGELRPLLLNTIKNDETLVLYINDVILSTLNFTVNTVFRRIISFGSGEITGRQALREACSSICMKLFGRSLVVSYDVIMTYSLSQLSTQLLLQADKVDQSGGIVEQIAELIKAPTLEHDFIAEVMEDTLRIAAQVFTPLPDKSRARIRKLLYSLIDTMPDHPDGKWLEGLAANRDIPPTTYDDMEGLAREVGGLLAENLMQFLNLVLLRLAQKALEILNDYVEAGLEAIEQWLDELEQVARAIYEWFLSLPQRFAALTAQIDAAIDNALAIVTDVLKLFASHQRRQTLIAAIQRDYQKQVLAALNRDPIYKAIPDSVGLRTPSKADIAAGVADLIGDSIVAVFVQPILNLGLTSLASNPLELIEDVRDLVVALREVDARQNIADKVTDIVLDWFAKQVREVFDNRDPGMKIALLCIDIGFVVFPLNDLISTVKSAVRSIDIFETLIRNLTNHVQAIVEEEEKEAALRLHEQAERVRQEEVKLLVTESQLTNLDVMILEPLAAAEYSGDLNIEIFLEGAPLSYLGLGEAVLPRITVLLNGEQLELDKFTVEEHKMPSDSNDRSASELSDIIRTIEKIGNLPSAERGAVLHDTTQRLDVIERGVPLITRQVRYQPGDKLDLFGRMVHGDNNADLKNYSYMELVRLNMNSRIAQRRDALPLGDSQRSTNREDIMHTPLSIPLSQTSLNSRQARTNNAQEWINRTGYVRSVSHQPATHMSRPVPDLTIITEHDYVSTEDARSNDKISVDPTLIGRIITIGRRHDLLTNAGHGLILRRRIPITALMEGINTLAVAITNGATVIENGRKRSFRIEEAVSFIATPPASGDRSNGVMGKPFSHLPELLRRAMEREEELKRTGTAPSTTPPADGENRPQPNNYMYCLPSRTDRHHQCQLGVKAMQAVLQSRIDLLTQYREAIKQNELQHYRFHLDL